MDTKKGVGEDPLYFFMNIIATILFLISCSPYMIVRVDDKRPTNYNSVRLFLWIAVIYFNFKPFIDNFFIKLFGYVNFFS